MMQELLSKALVLVCPELVQKWKAACKEFEQKTGFKMKALVGIRTFEQQAIEYQKGRAKNHAGEWVVVDPKLTVTDAKPGESFHHYGLAIDAIVEGRDPYLKELGKEEQKRIWMEYGACIKRQGLEWGGDWKRGDMTHCQLSYGLKSSVLANLYPDHNLNEIWIKCRQLSQNQTEQA